MIQRIKVLWGRAMHAVELGVSTLWFISSLILPVTLLFGYENQVFNILICLGFSLSGVLQWVWRNSVWPSLRNKH